MTNQIISSTTLILDTASGDTGSDVNFSDNQLNLNKNAYVEIEIASGDTVILEAKLSSNAAAYTTLDNGSFTANAIKSIRSPTTLRARRTVDGAVGDSKVWIKKLGSFNGV